MFGVLESPGERGLQLCKMNRNLISTHQSITSRMVDLLITMLWIDQIVRRGKEVT